MDFLWGDFLPRTCFNHRRSVSGVLVDSCVWSVRGRKHASVHKKRDGRITEGGSSWEHYILGKAYDYELVKGKLMWKKKINKNKQRWKCQRCICRHQSKSVWIHRSEQTTIEMMTVARPEHASNTHSLDACLRVLWEVASIPWSDQFGTSISPCWDEWNRLEKEGKGWRKAEGTVL